MLAGASNFTISGNARLYEIHGNAVINHLTDTDEQKKVQLIANIPRVLASQKDYETWKKSGPCFPGTRKALLREMMRWVTLSGESKMYILSGLAGIGKSTVVYTLAIQAEEQGLLGASFFFSRDDDDRNNARRFFSTIAYQLCVYDESFAKAIGDVLLTERGSAAGTQDPLEQLRVLILEPLQRVVLSRAQPILVVVDALDECNEEEEHAVVMGLAQLVRTLSTFRVILTTRPQPLANYLFASHNDHKIFHLQDIEDKVVDNDIELYLKYNLSREQIQKRYPKRRWRASDEQIDSLVHAAGRLFIIASTAVRYILDKSVSNPAAQMQKLLHISAQHQVPFKDLDDFYMVILRQVVPANCDNHVVNRYQSVLGAIIFVQHPLPVSTLSRLIDINVEEIRAVLDNLQSVVLLGNDDVPRIYHKSFLDYLTDQARCKDPCLRIDSKIHNTQIGSACFKVMDKYLKYNILGLRDPARFMSNEDGLRKDRIRGKQLQKNIPEQLRYACVYWVNHLEGADTALMKELTKFVEEHILHWIEVLSLIEKLDSAHRAILKLKKSTSSDLHQFLSDILRFIGKFYKIIEKSALHTYYSALPLTPTDSLLYRRYIKEAGHNICSIEGGPKKWDALIAHLNHGESVDIVKFSLDSTLLLSCSTSYYYHFERELKIWDAATGTLISTIPGHRFAIANDFSIVASAKDKTITFYNMEGIWSARDMFTTSSEIRKLALSSESGRVAAALADGTLWLWDSGNAELIDKFQDCRDCIQLEFSPTGTKLGYSLTEGIVKLRDGINGGFIADLRPASSESIFEFSHDGSRIASLSFGLGVSLWNSQRGLLIGTVKGNYYKLTISPHGSLLAAYWGSCVTLWKEKRNTLAEIDVLETGFAYSLAFSVDDILAIATEDYIALYNVKIRSFISTFTFGKSLTTLAFSPDRTCIAVGKSDGSVYLCDIRDIVASNPMSKKSASLITALALSQDCSRLACGYDNGAVELWVMNPTKRRIGAMLSRIYHVLGKYHGRPVEALTFSPNGRLFSSQSYDGTIKLWKSGDGSVRGTFIAQQVALSNTLLVTIHWHIGVKLWNLDTLSPIHTFPRSVFSLGRITSLSISRDSAFVAIAFYYNKIVLLDVVNHTAMTTFDVPLNGIHKMTFLPDNSHLIAHVDDDFLSINLRNKAAMKGSTVEHLAQLPDTPLWRGLPIRHSEDKDHHYFSASFSQDQKSVPILWIPRDVRLVTWTQASTMIALACENGCILLIRLPTSDVG